MIGCAVVMQYLAPPSSLASRYQARGHSSNVVSSRVTNRSSRLELSWCLSSTVEEDCLSREAPESCLSSSTMEAEDSCLCQAMVGVHKLLSHWKYFTHHVILSQLLSAIVSVVKHSPGHHQLSNIKSAALFTLSKCGLRSNL